MKLYLRSYNLRVNRTQGFTFNLSNRLKCITHYYKDNCAVYQFAIMTNKDSMLYNYFCFQSYNPSKGKSWVNGASLGLGVIRIRKGAYHGIRVTPLKNITTGWIKMTDLSRSRWGSHLVPNSVNISYNCIQPYSWNWRHRLNSP